MTPASPDLNPPGKGWVLARLAGGAFSVNRTRVRGGVEHLVFVFLPPLLRLFDNTVKKGKKINE